MTSNRGVVRREINRLASACAETFSYANKRRKYCGWQSGQVETSHQEGVSPHCTRVAKNARVSLTRATEVGAFVRVANIRASLTRTTGLNSRAP